MAKSIKMLQPEMLMKDVNERNGIKMFIGKTKVLKEVELED